MLLNDYTVDYKTWNEKYTFVVLERNVQIVVKHMYEDCFMYSRN